MRFKSTLALLAILVLIAAYYFLVDKETRIIGDRGPRDSTKMLPYGRDEIDGFVLINPYGDRIEMERQGSEWTIVFPVRTDAAQSTIDALLTQLLPGRKLEEFPDVADLSLYGLEDPYAMLIFHPVDTERSDTLYVGDKTPTRMSCYVRIGASDTVMIVREMTHNVVNKNLYHLRDKDFLYIPSSTIDSLSITKGGNRITLSREIAGWRIGEGGIRADAVLVESYLNDLTRAIIRDFAREDLDSLSAYGLDPPRGEISIFRGDEQIRISFGEGKEDQVYAIRTGIDGILLLEEKLIAALEWSPDDIRSRNLSFFEPAEVTEIICETPDKTVTFLKEPAGWSVSGIPVELAKPLLMLRMIKDARFESFTGSLGENHSGLEGPYSLRIRLKGSDDEGIDTITFYTAPSGSVEAVSVSAGMRGEIESGKLTEIERFLESL